MRGMKKIMRFPMLKFSWILTVVVIIMAFVIAPVSAAGPKAYLIGSSAPLTQAQVNALQAAGANIRYVYRNFGGAAASIANSQIDAVRALPFVTAVNVDTVRQVDSVAFSPAQQLG